jgi:hypothetical protein
MLDQAADIALVTVMAAVIPVLLIMTVCPVLAQRPHGFQSGLCQHHHIQHFLLFTPSFPNQNRFIQSKSVAVKHPHQAWQILLHPGLLSLPDPK